MKITLDSTRTIVTLNGFPARLWQGATESGIPIDAYIGLVGVVGDADASEFERDLDRAPAPVAVLDAIPLRMIL
jgi:hypothetical protein